MHHSISTTLDDFEYFRRPVRASLPWAAAAVGTRHYSISTTPDEFDYLPWSGDRQMISIGTPGAVSNNPVAT